MCKTRNIDYITVIYRSGTGVGLWISKDIYIFLGYLQYICSESFHADNYKIGSIVNATHFTIVDHFLQNRIIRCKTGSFDYKTGPQKWIILMLDSD